MNNKKLQIDVFFFNNLRRHVEISKREWHLENFQRHSTALTIGITALEIL